MKWVNAILGRRLANSEQGEQRVGPAAGIPMLGLDALTSSAYGPEATLTILIALGHAGTQYAIPITAIIIGILILVFLSYRQTIAAYPKGGGSYTVAKDNLGQKMALLAAASLLLDYVLTAAVGISAGIGALISAIPHLQSATLPLCLIVLVVICLANLRGIKDSGAFFAFPTYLFIASLLILVAVGAFKIIVTGGHPQSLVKLPVVPQPAIATAGFWLLLRAFASGCAAMTGVEAVSNGVPAFREPVVDNARRTLTAIVVILILMLAGIAVLCKAYGVTATPAGTQGYESVLSQLVGAVFGHGVWYGVTIGSVILALALSANTAFADFPRLCSIIAKDHFLPESFAERGRRLVFSYGILALTIIAAILLAAFDGVTDRLIPLYAVGAFLAFTLSQSGMVVHWWKRKKDSWKSALVINLLGAIGTGVTLVVILVAKFTEGAWISVIIVPVLLAFFSLVKNYYVRLQRAIATDAPLNFRDTEDPIVLVPVRDWTETVRKSLQFATGLSSEVIAVHIDEEEDHDELKKRWPELVERPAKAANRSVPKLVALPSPYRRVFGSLITYIEKLRIEFPNRKIAIVIPHVLDCHWYSFFLHNQRAVLLDTALMLKGDRNVFVIQIPWYLK